MLVKRNWLRVIALRLSAAVLVAGAWSFHVAEVRHDPGDAGCQVCAVSVSPELNVDCGTILLARPDNFAAFEAARPGPPPDNPFIAAFLGRAPPR